MIVPRAVPALGSPKPWRRRVGDWDVSAETSLSAANAFAKPKSRIFGFPSGPILRFAGFRSLPDLFAADPERLARFEREAKLLASLNHENIATLYGFGESDSIRFLAMELVEGETLAERLDRGPMELEEALALFRQIALALEAAHEKGVIHRDLKSANIKITEDGKIKVLDFGLGKALAPALSEEDLSQSPTAAYSGTMAGVIMGTAPYMSPEQARGRTVDQRTDVWAFGCVLYEALTGKKPFEGETVTDTLAAVVRAEPEWSALPQTTPSSIRRLLRRALTKERARRLPHMGAARLEIDDAGDETSVDNAAEPSRQRRLPLALTALLLVTMSGFAVWAITRPSAPRLVRLVISASPDEAFYFGGNPPGIAISPDGTHVIYRSDRQQLRIRALDQFEASSLANLGTNPFVSPDGEWIGFFADGALKKIATRGGPAITLCAVDGFPRGASWGPDDTIVFASRDSEGLKRVSALGGEPETLTVVDRESGETNHRWPEVLPDGRAVVFEVDRRGGIESSSIAVLSLDTGDVRELLTGGSFPRYAPTGHLVYAGLKTLWAAGFDPRRLELTSAPVPVLAGVATTSANAANFGLAKDGTLVYVPGNPRSADRTLVWVDRQGQEEPIGGEPRPYVSVALSPDGTRVASEIRDSNVDVWIYDLSRQTSTRLTFDAETEGAPVWTSDGERIVFTSAGNLAWKAADGTGVAEPLPSTGAGAPWSALPNDQGVIATRRRPEMGWDIDLVSLEEATPVLPVIEEPFDQYHPSLSLDGRWIAYQSNESGRDEVYVRPFPDVASGKWQISSAGGSHPVWARSGRELFYRSSGEMIEMMAVAIETEPAFAPGNPTGLFEDPYLRNLRRNYDISLDGQRFLMIKEGSSNDAPRELHVVLNWFEELKRLVPAP